MVKLDYNVQVFTKKKNYWGYILIIFLSFCYVGYAEKRDYELKKALKYCREAQAFAQEQSTHVWIMDKSCSKQLTNSVDGVLRIKVNSK
jgi:hypothetical protein